MTSTDETRSDNSPDDEPVDATSEESFALPRVRRSTYTPPPRYRELLDEAATDAEPESTETAPPSPDHVVYSLDDAPSTVEPPVYSPVVPPLDPPSDPPGSGDENAVPSPSAAPDPDLSQWAAPTPDPSSQWAAPPSWGAPSVPPASPPVVPPFERPAAAAFAMPPVSRPPVSPPPAAPDATDHVPTDPGPLDFTIPAWEPVAEQPDAPAPAAEPLSAPPTWSLDSDLPETVAPEPSAPYRAWTPDPPRNPPRSPTESWEALFPTSPPPAFADDSAPASFVEPEPEPAPASEPFAEPEAVPETVAEAETVPETAGEPDADSEPVETTGPPVYMTPDDEAATLALHAPPAGQPWIPQRRSLPDDELVDVLDAASHQPGGTLSAMEALEHEMLLRAEEKQEYREWEDSMLAVGTPEALAVVAQVRPEFTAIVVPEELITSAIPIQWAPEDAPEKASPEPPSPEQPSPEQAGPEQPSPEQSGTDQAGPEQAQSPEPIGETPAVPEARADLPAMPTVPEAPAVPTGYPVPPALVEPAAVAAPPLDWATPAPAATAPAATAPATPISPVQDAAAAAAPSDFDSLLGEPAPATGESPPDAAPREKAAKRPFGVAVDNDGNPESLAAASAAERAPLFSLELAGERPTPIDERVGRASRLFWLWFAANSSIVSIAFGAMVFSLGMSLRQSIVAALAGVALSFIPLGLGTLAGKRSGQPTMVVSRAAFGLVGNVLPSVLALVSRVFWGAVLLWLFAASISTVVGGSGSTAGLVVIFIVVGVMIAVVVAFVGYTVLARFQLVVSILAAVLLVGFVVLTWDRVDIASALSVGDGPWIRVLTGAVLVFSFVGLVWANSASDLARFQRPGGSGGANMLWATFGATLPTFLLIAYGALLAASDADFARDLMSAPIDALAGALPVWYPIPLVIATGLSLLSGVIVTVYSGAFALQAIGLRIERQWATFVLGALLAVVAVGFSVLDIDLTDIFRDLATTLAVPVAAWAGIFAADTMIRNRPFHTPSLLGLGGIYPRVNRINLPALVVITIIGWGLTTASVAGLGWQGYLFTLTAIDLNGDLAATDLGVVVALLLGLLTPVVFGVRAIARQEAAARRS